MGLALIVPHYEPAGTTLLSVHNGAADKPQAFPLRMNPRVPRVTKKTPATPHSGGRVTQPCSVYLLERLRCLGQYRTLMSAVRHRFLFAHSYYTASAGNVNPTS